MAADWKKLAAHIVARRVELGYRTTRQLAQAVGITEQTIGRLELGHSVRAGTLAAVEYALGWLPGSTDAILEGGEPRVDPAPRPAAVGATRQWANLAWHVRSRRVELGFATTRQLAGTLGISFRTIGRLERGQSVGANTLAAVENILGWTAGSAEAVLAGGAPELRQRPQTPDVSATRRRILRASADELVDMRAAYEEVMGAEAADEWLRKALQLLREAEPEPESATDCDAS